MLAQLLSSHANSLVAVLRACQQEINCLSPQSVFVLLREAYSNIPLF